MAVPLVGHSGQPREEGPGEVLSEGRLWREDPLGEDPLAEDPLAERSSSADSTN